MLQKLWYDRPVRTQLLVAVGLINLVALLVAVSVSILNTRTATRVEIEASLEVAQRFVNATIKDLAAQGQIDQLEQQLPLQLKHLRHVRIYLMDTIGQLTVVSPADESVKLGAATGSRPWSVRNSSDARCGLPPRREPCGHRRRACRRDRGSLAGFLSPGHCVARPRCARFSLCSMWSSAGC